MTVEVKHGGYRYPHTERQILNDIGFSLPAGEVLAVLGPNGAGKTTLLRCLTGLLPWQTGETLLDGVSLKSILPKERWKRISYVPQAKGALPAYTVEEMLLLGRASAISPFSVPGKEDMEAVERCIERNGLQELRHRSCAKISGGEFQSVLIARALVSDPGLLVLDEPESNLDMPNQLRVLRTVSGLSEQGVTCILNTHYPAHALRIATKVLLLGKDGSFCYGGVRETVTEENIRRFFGVRAVIGELQTPDGSFADVFPVSVIK